MRTVLPEISNRRPYLDLSRSKVVVEMLFHSFERSESFHVSHPLGETLTLTHIPGNTASCKPGSTYLIGGSRLRRCCAE